MVSFENDYNTGAHEAILNKLVELNREPSTGYGHDPYTLEAYDKIKKACKCEDAQIYFAVGGTQTNQVVISSLLKSYEGVISASTGHINVHESGAIEYSGHKVLSIPNHLGKIDSNELNDYLEKFFGDPDFEHMVFPGMVYISHPTEYGSVYSKDELTKISNICKKYNIPLYLDGARLAYGLMCNESTLTLDEIAKLVDVFYIGGTKCGAICGEAIVFTHNNMPKYFETFAKQRGALLAKGRLLGIQFSELFTNDLYYKIGKHANEMKDKMVTVLKNNLCRFFYNSPSNQQFIIMDNKKLEKFSKLIKYSTWEKVDEDNTVIRLVTSWSTNDNDIQELDKALKSII